MKISLVCKCKHIELLTSCMLSNNSFRSFNLRWWRETLRTFKLQKARSKTHRDFETMSFNFTDSITSLHPQARGEVPRLPNGIPEKSSRPDRPRARDRPKPRRRPRPKEPGEATTRRSRSAPAQSSPAVPQPPTHTAHHEGFLFRKLDIESLKKSTNRWVFRVIMMSVTSGLADDSSQREGWCKLVSWVSDWSGQIVLESNVYSLIWYYRKVPTFSE